MPEMDGLEAAQSHPDDLDREDCKKIPIYAMSANAFDEDVKRSLASGMNGHLSKPVDHAGAGENAAESAGMKINGFLMHLVQYIDSLCQPRLLQTGLCYIYGNIEGSNHKHEISEYHR